MPSNNGKNENNTNDSNYNARAAARKQKRTEKLKAKHLKNNKVYRPANSGKYEHLKKVLAEFNKNTKAYIRFKNRKFAEEMAKQNNKQKPENAPEQVNQTKPETEIKNENNVIIEEPVIKEEPQKPIEEVVNENGVETMGLEDVKVDDADLDDPELDKELAQLEEKMKKEEELKAQGIDPDTVEEPDDSEFAQEFRDLMQENEEKLEGAALEEAFQSLSDEIEGENKDSEADENDDPSLDEEINLLAEEIKNEEAAAKTEENEPEVAAQTNQTEEADDIIVEDVKEEVEKIQPVETNEIKLLGEEKVELSAPIMNEQIENNETVEIKPDEITEIKVEKQNEPTLADDFEPMKNNSNEPKPEQIKIVENLPDNIEGKQVNTETKKLDTRAFFQTIENNLTKPKIEENVVVAPQPKEKPKPTYSVPPIPGMRSPLKQENVNNAPKLTEEERKEKELANAKAQLKRLQNIHTGTTEERRDREKMISYYQGIVNKHKSIDELFKESLELSEKAKREAKEREDREKQLKELENSVKNDIVEDRDNENESLELKNEAEAVTSLRIADFYDKLGERMGDHKVSTQVISDMTEIIKEAGIKDQEKATDIAEYSYFDIKDTINSIYDSKTVTKTQMSTDAPIFFYNAFLSLSKANLNNKDRIITAQKIADVMIKNYSPVAFVEKELDRFADNYVLKDAELLGAQLYSLGFKNQDVHKLTNELFGVPENEHTEPEIETAPEQQPEPPKPEPPKPEPPKPEPPKPEPPKPEPPKQEPPKQEPPKPEPPKPEPPKQNAAPAQNLGPEWISMPEFDQKLERLDKIKALPGNVKREISSILKDSGIETGGADDPLEFAEIIKDAYDPKKLSRDVPQSMRDITKSVFISTYNALSKKGFTPENKIETTQRIADVFLKLYSPASLSSVKELQKYTQNYVIGDKQLLRECLTSLNVPENEINTIIGEPKPEAKPEVKPEVKTEVKTEAKPEVKTEAKPEVKTEAKPEVKLISNDGRVAVFTEKLKTYNNMYKLNIDSNNFASSVTDAWTLMTSGDKQKMTDGQKVMNDLFKDTLKAAFNIEKGAAYDEHRLPEYAEIIKSTNELLRSSMYAITDMYHNQNRKNLFDATAFGGLNAKDMSELIVGESLWDKDQKSDEAWEIQSKEAKNIADKWLKENKPYEKMISEMKALVNANKDNIVSRKEVLDKLTAAEWLLINNEKMMIDDPEDPLNPIPNWGNRYWKALTETREALGIDKHTSMRDLIQGDYAAMAKPASNANYNQTQIQLYVLDEDVRELSDSMEVQKEQFATMSATVTLTKPTNENKQLEKEMTENRVQYIVHELDQREIMKNEPKVFSNMVIERTNELTIESKANQI